MTIEVKKVIEDMRFRAKQKRQEASSWVNNLMTQDHEVSIKYVVANEVANYLEYLANQYQQSFKVE